MDTLKDLHTSNSQTRTRFRRQWPSMTRCSVAARSRWDHNIEHSRVRELVIDCIWILFQVMPKRTNKPGITSTNRPPRGRGGFRARGGRGRGYGGGYMRRPRGGYRGYRGGYSPYWVTASTNHEHLLWYIYLISNISILPPCVNIFTFSK